MSTAPQTAAPSGQPALTEDAFLADRQKFWGEFTGATLYAVIAIVVLLLALLIFLV